MMGATSSAVIVPLVGAVLVIVYTWLGHQQAIRREMQPTEGYYRSQGLAWGLAAGLLIDAALTAVSGNTFLGIIVGVPTGLLGGLVVGELQERRHRGAVRPLNSDEKEERRFMVLLALGAILLAVLSVLGITLFSR
jgi:hypothetical protein